MHTWKLERDTSWFTISKWQGRIQLRLIPKLRLRRAKLTRTLPCNTLNQDPQAVNPSARKQPSNFQKPIKSIRASGTRSKTARQRLHISKCPATFSRAYVHGSAWRMSGPKIGFGRKAFDGFPECEKAHPFNSASTGSKIAQSRKAPNSKALYTVQVLQLWTPEAKNPRALKTKALRP